MKTVLIIHGVDGHAGIHWQQWLHDELVHDGVRVIMPTLPSADHPRRKKWLEELQKLVSDVDFSELTIVGHSLGVPAALDLVEAEEKKIVGLISVSGFGDDYSADLNSYFMRERNIDYKKVRSLTKKRYVIYGDDDPYVPQEILRKLADDLGVEPKAIKQGGHLNTRAGYTKFPLLLELV